MKKQLLLFSFSFFLFTFAFSQDYGWKDISANIPGNPDLSDMFFISDYEGWITSSSHAVIYHTTDGGLTFDVQTTGLKTEAIHMLNENEGYCGGASGFVYKTIDGGINWNFHGTIGATLADISFPPSGGTGYACGLNGAISSITTSGVIQMASNVNGGLYSISFPINNEEGWVCGGSVIRHYAHNIWNGDQDYPSGGYNAIFMIDTLNGWAVGDYGIIIHTEDGQNWFEQTNPDISTYKTLRSVFFQNSHEGWAGGTSSILHTTNGGTTWTVDGVGLTIASVRSIHFTSTTNGYIVGNNKTLLKYTDISGIGDYQNNFVFEIFPNPVQDKFEMRSSEFGVDAGKVVLYDLNSKKLLEESIKKGEECIEIDVSHLERGMYFCKISIGNRSSTKKIIKE